MEYTPGDQGLGESEVLKVEDWIAIGELRRQGIATSEIARRTGRDPKTMRRVLEESGPKVRPNTWKGVSGKLEPFEDYVLGRIEQGCLNAAVLLEEISVRGYTGKATILRDFIRPIRQELVRKREAAERFETGPGKQGQVDWAEFGRIWDLDEEHWRKLYGFVLTLGYSRAPHLQFTTCCDMEHFLDCHVGAFASLGIPEHLLYDNLKTGILGRRSDGSPIFPGRFLDFALYYCIVRRRIHSMTWCHGATRRARSSCLEQVLWGLGDVVYRRSAGLGNS